MSTTLNAGTSCAPTPSTNTFPFHPKRIFPEVDQEDTCKICKQKTATLKHMLWKRVAQRKSRGSSEALSLRWAAVMSSFDLSDQPWAVQQAGEAALRRDPDASSWGTCAWVARTLVGLFDMSPFPAVLFLQHLLELHEEPVLLLLESGQLLL